MALEGGGCLVRRRADRRPTRRAGRRFLLLPSLEYALWRRHTGGEAGDGRDTGGFGEEQRWGSTVSALR